MEDPRQSNPLITPPANAVQSVVPQTSGLVGPDEILNKDILDLIGMSHLAEEEKGKLYQTMVETIERRVVGRVDEMLSDEEAEEWKKIVDAKDRQGFSDFLKEKSIDLVQIYAQEALIYKTELVSMIRALEQAKPKQ
jgi:hypothetical protein